MEFVEQALQGVFVIDIDRQEDSRGWFARSWAEEEFASNGLVSRISQCSISYNKKQGTVRGMHYQAAPHQETKLVSCVRGSIADVVVDLRPDSDTYMKHITLELSAQNHRILYIPAGCAHGFQTQEDETEVYYQISTPYAPEFARGVRWDDPMLTISWPLPVTVISDRDQQYPDFTKSSH